MTDEDRADRSATSTIEQADGEGARIETFEVTSAIVASDFAASGGPDFELPAEMLGTIERIWQDREFTWPTAVSVLAIDAAVDDSGTAWSRVSVLGSGWAAGTPVTLRFENSSGTGDEITRLPSAEPSDTGFFGVDISFRTLPRASGAWRGSDDQVSLVAEQQVDGDRRSARQDSLPAHTIWRWVR